MRFIEHIDRCVVENHSRDDSKGNQNHVIAGAQFEHFGTNRRIGRLRTANPIGPDVVQPAKNKRDRKSEHGCYEEKIDRPVRNAPGGKQDVRPLHYKPGADDIERRGAENTAAAKFFQKGSHRSGAIKLRPYNKVCGRLFRASLGSSGPDGRLARFNEPYGALRCVP